MIRGDYFNYVKTFKIDGLRKLKSLKIGKNSFTWKKNYYGNDESKSFHILNCESLESIEIGDYCFSDFAGVFELQNLPSLQSISVGTFDQDSYCFHSGSFVVHSKYDNLFRLQICQIYNLLHLEAKYFAMLSQY